MATDGSNLLYYGDNLDVLRRYVKDESVDLVYLDPPFNSNADYNAFFAEQDGSRSAAQIKAFEDTWRWDQSAAGALHDFLVAPDVPDRAKQAMLAFEKLLGHSNMLAYLAMMAPRLVELWRGLKPTGSLYLHCDPTASHYLKLMLDAIFGVELFENEIIWKRTSAHSDAKRWSSVADKIFHYSKSKRSTWNPQHVLHSTEYVSDKYRHNDDNGRIFQLDNMTSPQPRPNMMYEWKGHASPVKGWRYSKETMARLDAEGRIWYPKDKKNRPRLKRYLDEMKGLLLSNVWTDIAPINSQAQERLGYPTQKPLALLERIILASSNEGDTVLDPFCGCGTTVAAAQKLKRRWIGIDITSLATSLIKNRLLESYGKEIGKSYAVLGEPTVVEEAARLAETDPYQFQWWALGLVGARPMEQKKGADKGIDGRLYFHDDAERGQVKQVIFSVKAGKNVGVAMVRDLGHVVDREKAQIGVLLTMAEPTGPMKTEAAGAGFYVSPGHTKHPKLQILTVGDLLAGVQVDLPRFSDLRTFKKAPKVKPSGGSSTPMLGFDSPDEEVE